MSATTRAVLFATLATSSLAFAAPVSVSVGETKVVGVSSVAKVRIEDPSVVTARTLKTGSGVAFVGKVAGKTLVHLKTYGGGELSLTIYVTPSGSRNYATQESAAAKDRQNVANVPTETAPSAQTSSATDSPVTVAQRDEP